MKLVIIAGGKGSRLGRQDIPKPMVLIGQKPLLEHQIILAAFYGITDIYIMAGYLPEAIFNYFKNGADWNVKISYIIEPYPLGTAGSVKLAEYLLDERFMLFYGDILLDVDLNHFMDFDRQQDSLATVLVHPNDHPDDSDLIRMDTQNRITHFYPKPHTDGNYYQNLVNAGVYILSPEIFQFIAFGVTADFGKDIFLKILIAGKIIRGYKSAEYCKDMGTEERLQQVTADFNSGKVQHLNRKNKQCCIFLDRDGTINKFADHLSDIDDFELMDEAGAAVKKINQSGYLAIVITNQPVIAKGLLTENGLSEIHKKMETLLGKDHAFLNDIYYCPHHPEAGFEGEVKALKIDCDCRKPKAGMIFQAASDYHIDLSNSWMIGDRPADMLAGKNAGCRTIYLNDALQTIEFADHVLRNILEAVNFILSKND